MECKTSLYNLWRKDCGPTLYPSNKTPVTADVLEAGFIFTAVILAVSFLVIIPGYRGLQKLFVLIRVVIGIFVLTSIMVCNFGQEWEVSERFTKTPYRAGIDEEIHAHIGVKIGLRSVNITLLADPEEAIFKNGTHVETINYNERYSWNSMGFTQGRNGFGPFAGQYNREFRASQFRGTPLPVLWIAEYFTIDGEGIRWGRHYRQAGWYAHIMMWSAFPLWLLALVMPYMVLLYAGYCSMMTGVVLLIANILFAGIRNRNELHNMIPFEDGKMEFYFGWCFWLNLINGILCFILGIVIVIMDVRFPEKIATFFGVDILQEYEEYYADAAEIQANIEKAKHRHSHFPSIFRKKKSRHGNGNATQLQEITTSNGAGPSSHGAGPSRGGGGGASNGGADAREVNVEVYEDVEDTAGTHGKPAPVVQMFRRRENSVSRFVKTAPPPLPTKFKPRAAGAGAVEDNPGLPVKHTKGQVKHGAHHTAQVKQPQQQRTKKTAAAAAAVSTSKPATGQLQLPLTNTPKASPQVKPKPKKHPQGDAVSSASAASSGAGSSTDLISQHTPREDNGRSTGAPEAVMSGSYDNNYENESEIQRLADERRIMDSKM